MAHAFLPSIIDLPTGSAVGRWQLGKGFTFGLCLALSLAQRQGAEGETVIKLGVFIQSVKNPDNFHAVQPNKPEKVELGSSFDMSCHMKPGGNKNAVVTWYKNEQVFSPTSRAISTGWLRPLYQDYQIRFLNFSLEDAGAYTCVTNQGMVHANLTVAPVIKNFDRVVVAYEGESALLRCDAKGYPKPTVKWLDKDNAVYQAAVNNELTFPKVSTLQNGTYRCVANNSAGTVVETTSLYVVVRLSFKNAMPSVKDTSVGDTVILKCGADGRPTPNYKWFVKTGASERRPVINAGPVYAVRNVQADDELRNFTCEVHSYFPGSHRPAQEPLVHTFHLRLGERKEPPTKNGGIAVLALPLLVLASSFIQFIVSA